VVIDGSNVAHNSQCEKDAKPSMQNIITLCSFLKAKGFSDISVIVDASLKYKIEDGDKLPTLKELATYIIAPKETSADMFIIDMVKQTHCLLVSNDTFREWKKSDPWIATNVDFYRLTFMITNEKVYMPDLK